MCIILNQEKIDHWVPLPSLKQTGNLLLQANIPEKMKVGDTVILQDQNGKIRISIYTGERTSQGSSGYLSQDYQEFK